ncbi:MAG: glycoside hydrolase family 11 protein [Defluviitaleaceae bacterium]|nr:glycoside hydrolase family 11 protein [Defluviitaleaceae bacterium]
MKLLQKRTLAWVIAVLMVIAIMPTSVSFAEEPEYVPEYETEYVPECLPEYETEDIAYEYYEHYEDNYFPIAAFSANLPATAATVNLTGIPTEQILFNTATGGIATIAVSSMVTASSAAGGSLMAAYGFNHNDGVVFTLTVPAAAQAGDYLMVAGRRHAAGSDGNISFGDVQIGQGGASGAGQFNFTGNWAVTIPNVSPGQTITLTVNSWFAGPAAERLNAAGFTISIDQVVIRANVDPYAGQRTALQTAITTAQRIVRQAYTSETWTAFNNALTAAVAGVGNTATGAGLAMDGLRTTLATAQGNLTRTTASPSWNAVNASDLISSRHSTFTVVGNGIHITGRGVGPNDHNNGMWLNINAMRQAYAAGGGTANAQIVITGYMAQVGGIATQGLAPSNINANVSAAHGAFTLTIPSATSAAVWAPGTWWGTADNPFPVLATAGGVHAEILVTGIQVGTLQIADLLSPPTTDVRTTNFRSRLNGWDVELWTQYPGGVEMTIHPSGAFTGTWDGTFNTLFRSGRGFPGRGTRIADIGDILMRYDVPYFSSTRGPTYLGIYGWARTATAGDTIVEWYIIDNWREWIVGGGNPPATITGNYTNHGNVTIDGHIYDIATAWRVEQPSIEGTTTFLQIFSVRRGSRQTINTGPFSGTINVSAHFEAWDEIIGLQTHAGSGRTVHFTRDMLLTEVSFLVEGFGGNTGSAGRGQVANLCLAYGSDYICTWNGCVNCDDLTSPGPGTPGTPNENIVWELDITPALAEGLNTGEAAIGGVQRAAPTPIGAFGFDYVAGALVVRGRTENWHSLDILLGDKGLSTGGEYRITAVGVGTGTTQLQFSWPLDGTPWEIGNVNGSGGTVSQTFTSTMPSAPNGVTVTPPRIRLRTNGGTGNFTITSIVIERVGEAPPPPPPPPPYCDYNSYDFQSWLSNHGEGLLGGERNSGSWPFWNTGNQDIIVENIDGSWQMAVPGSGTGGATGYGTHGVLLRLTGPNSLNIRAGYRIEAVGYIRGEMTATIAPPGVAFRPGHEGGSPGSNLVHVPISTGVPDQPFTISYVVRHEDFIENAAHWSEHPALQIVRQPSQFGLFMVIQDLKIFPICDCADVQPTGITIAPAGNFSLETGETRSLTATVIPADANQAVVWESSNTSVATISVTSAGATVTAVAAGTATITARSAQANTVTSSVDVTVTVANGGTVPRPPAGGGGGAIVRPSQPSTQQPPGQQPPIQQPPGQQPPGQQPPTQPQQAPAEVIVLDNATVTIPSNVRADIIAQGDNNFRVNVAVEESNVGIASVDVSIVSADTQITSLVSYIEIAVVLDDVDVANTHRIIALDADGTIMGGSYNPETGEFVFETAVTGEFTIVYVESLVRVVVTMGSPIIYDLAGNSPTVTMDVLPIIQEGRTLLPVRFVAEALGGSADWDAVSQEVSITIGDTSLSFVLGQIVPGMDVPPQSIDGRTMVPARFIANAFGAFVGWDSGTQSFEIII